LKSFTQLYIAIIIDYSKNELNYNLFIDDLQSNKVLSLSNAPEKVTATTGFYVHQSVVNTNCECVDPRLDQDLAKFLTQRNDWQVQTDICNLPGTRSCSKCVFLQGDAKTTCILCASGFSNILGQCLPTKVCTAWVDLQTYQSQFGPASHGDNDNDLDESPEN